MLPPNITYFFAYFNLDLAFVVLYIEIKYDIVGGHRLQKYPIPNQVLPYRSPPRMPPFATFTLLYLRSISLTLKKDDDLCKFCNQSQETTVLIKSLLLTVRFKSIHLLS